MTTQTSELPDIAAGSEPGQGHRASALRQLARDKVAVLASFGLLTMVTASALGFLGLGAQPPTAELGMMAAQGRDFLFISPHISIVPAMAIFVIVLCANLLGDALRDVLDPRLQQ